MIRDSITQHLGFPSIVDCTHLASRLRNFIPTQQILDQDFTHISISYQIIVWAFPLYPFPPKSNPLMNPLFSSLFSILCALRHPRNNDLAITSKTWICYRSLLPPMAFTPWLGHYVIGASLLSVIASGELRPISPFLFHFLFCFLFHALSHFVFNLRSSSFLSFHLRMMWGWQWVVSISIKFCPCCRWHARYHANYAYAVKGIIVTTSILPVLQMALSLPR